MKVLSLFSGGKDSQAALIWAVNEYGVENVEALTLDTVWENPVTYQHIIDVCKKMGVKLHIEKTKKYDGFLDLAKKKGRFPSMTARFCTEELKQIPAIDFMLSHNENIIVIEGIRANESIKRSYLNQFCTFFKYYFEPYKINSKGKKMFMTYRKKDVIKWCAIYNADKIRPVFDWTAEQVIDYIRKNGQEPNPLYFQGFKRVGCFPCVHESHKGVKLIIDNHPEQWEKVKKAEEFVGSGFFKPDYVPKRFRSNKIYSSTYDIEKYLNEKNATSDLFETETPSCMSAYNLCE